MFLKFKGDSVWFWRWKVTATPFQIFCQLDFFGISSFTIYLDIVYIYILN